jgi:hypothetical protein
MRRLVDFDEFSAQTFCGGAIGRANHFACLGQKGRVLRGIK